MRLRMTLLATGLLAATAAGQGVAYCPRVTSEHNADTTDLKRFRSFAPWKDKNGGDLVVAIWQYLCDHETGLYHFYEVLDGPDPYSEYSTMREPLKMLNVYNCGYCGIFGPTTEGILHGCGFQSGRSFALAAWNHCATEIFYDDAWHYFDVDVRGAIRKADGSIASLAEARTSKQLWVDSLGKIEPYFPHAPGKDGIAKVADIYARNYPGGTDYQYRWFQGSHTADFSLRPGESLTRWWDDQTGRWNHRPSYNKEKWVRELILTKPVGMKPNHRDFTKWNHGGGLFHYAPKLTEDSGDFAAGVLTSEGLAPGKGGLTLTKDSGEAVFGVFTPFVIVAKINDIMNEEDDAEAALVTLDAAGPVRVSLSLDNGMTWKDAGGAPAGKKTLDLTKWVKGTYGYLLKLHLAGEKGATALRGLALDTWVQVAPVSLPRLKKGTNHLRYDAGDRYDGATVPMLVLPNVADPEDLKKYVVEMPKDYDPTRNLARIKGAAVVKMQAPAGQKIAWLSVGGTFNTHQQKGATSTANSIGYAVGRPEEFKTVYKADCPTWVQHWRYNWDTDIQLDKPAETVFVRFLGDPGLNVIRACLHLTPPKAADPAVRVTHGYRMGGQDVEKAVDMPRPGDYTIDCPGDVENVFVRIEKPSR